MKINKYADITAADTEARKAYIDKHSPFIYCEKTAKAGEKFKITVKVGNEYAHPDDFDHYIAWIQLWDKEFNLGHTSFPPGVLGNKPGHVEVDFHIVPTRNMKLSATAFCNKHGLWQSDEVEITVTE